MVQRIILISLFILSLSCCENDKPTEGENQNPQVMEGEQDVNTEGSFPISPDGENQSVGNKFWPDKIPFDLSYRIVSKYPHDATAFTQGLVWVDGLLYESTGLWEQSSVRIVELETGIPVTMHALPQQFNGQEFDRLFGEGLAIVGDLVYQLTWKNGVCFVYSRNNLELQNIFNYTGEGWGLTSDGENLIMSDGTDNIYFRSPGTFKVVRTIQVKQRGTPISNLNELEYIEGYICANVWYKNFIAVINPTTGEVVGRIELDGLKEQLVNAEQADVLNGIAYNPETKHLLITGKLWDTLFEIELAPKVTK